MRIILLERVAKLGQMGDIVDVKSGFARNFLIPQKKAAPATTQHIQLFEEKRAQIEAYNLETKNEALKIQDKLKNVEPVIITQASETGQLYGSVKARDVAQSLSVKGFTLSHKQISISPIKTIGCHNINVNLHPEVDVTVKLYIATNEEEAHNFKNQKNTDNKTSSKKPEHIPSEQPIVPDDILIKKVSPPQENNEEALSDEDTESENQDQNPPSSEEDSNES
jgi:large subunit ribosomal protein L9